MIYNTTYNSPVGNLTLAATDQGLLGLWIESQKNYPARLVHQSATQDRHPVFDSAKHWLEDYFGGLMPSHPNFHLCPQGSEFRQRIWQILLQIPYGQTMTYGEIARIAGCRSAQAVGGAVGHNPISIIIPCHRVIGANGSLTGYDGGLDKKRWLLRHEGIQIKERK